MNIYAVVVHFYDDVKLYGKESYTIYADKEQDVYHKAITASNSSQYADHRLSSRYVETIDEIHNVDLPMGLTQEDIHFLRGLVTHERLELHKMAKRNEYALNDVQETYTDEMSQYLATLQKKLEDCAKT